MDYEQEPEIKAIRRLIKEQSELEQQIKDTKVQIQAFASDLLVRTAGDLTQVATYLYWEIPEIHVETIGKPFGTRRYATSRYITPLNIGNCSVCGNPIIFKNRADLESRVERTDKIICHGCDFSERNKESRLYYEIKAKSQEEIDAENKRRARRWNELSTMPYNEYLLTPEWQEKRAYMLKRARYRCQLCNESKPLNVHHRTYERRGHEDYADLIVLCGDCHKLYHFHGQTETE